jgi:hypothetical protein
MPTIIEFFFILIRMYYDDHNRVLAERCGSGHGCFVSKNLRSLSEER